MLKYPLYSTKLEHLLLKLWISLGKVCIKRQNDVFDRQKCPYLPVSEAGFKPYFNRYVSYETYV